MTSAIHSDAALLGLQVCTQLPFALTGTPVARWDEASSGHAESAEAIQAAWAETLSLSKPGLQQAAKASATLSLDWRPGPQEPIASSHVSPAPSLVRELETLAAQLPRRPVLRQLEMGPPLSVRLGEGDLETLLAAADARFEGLSSCDRIVKVDAWSPHTAGLLPRFSTLGFRHVSLMLGALTGRRPLDGHATAGLVRQAHALGMTSVHVQFECPQEERHAGAYLPWLEAVLAARPQRVELCRPSASVAFVSAEASGAAWSLWLKTVHALATRGYGAVGPDWFALANDPMALAKRAGHLVWRDGRFFDSPATDIYGLGPGHHSRVCGASVRNFADEHAYSLALERQGLPVCALRRWNRLELARETMISALICQEHLEYQALELAHFVKMSRDLGPEMRALRELEGWGLLTCQDDGVQVTPQGRLLSANLRHALSTAAQTERVH